MAPRAQGRTILAAVHPSEPLVPDIAHNLGPTDAAVTLIEFGDFGCPHCAAARMPIESLVLRLGQVRLIWRHFPDTELHPGADLAAEASEAAAEQEAFWPMHEALLAHQGGFARDGLHELASDLGLDVEKLDAAMEDRRFAPRIEGDIRDARDNGVGGTPTFFVNGERHTGHWTELRTALPRAISAVA